METYQDYCMEETDKFLKGKKIGTHIDLNYIRRKATERMLNDLSVKIEKFEEINQQHYK